LQISKTLFIVAESNGVIKVTLIKEIKNKLVGKKPYFLSDYYIRGQPSLD